MIHEKINISEDGCAYVEMYIPDPQISYGVERTWPVALICPGGGYVISATKEKEAVAMQFLAKGYACFVLRYTTFLKDRESLFCENIAIDENAYFPTQVLQLMWVMHYIHEHHKRLSLDITNIFTVGFSAGAHITGMLALRHQDEYFIKQLPFVPKDNELRIKGCIMGYPMLSSYTLHEEFREENGIPNKQYDIMKQCLYGHEDASVDEIQQHDLKKYITSHAPAMFIWHTVDDMVTNSKETTEFIKTLQQHQVACEYHLFMNGKHGLACANAPYATRDDDIDDTIAMWLPLAFQWLEKIKKVGYTNE